MQWTSTPKLLLALVRESNPCVFALVGGGRSKPIIDTVTVLRQFKIDMQVIDLQVTLLRWRYELFDK